MKKEKLSQADYDKLLAEYETNSLLTNEEIKQVVTDWADSGEENGFLHCIKQAQDEKSRLERDCEWRRAISMELQDYNVNTPILDMFINGVLDRMEEQSNEGPIED